MMNESTRIKSSRVLGFCDSGPATRVLLLEHVTKLLDNYWLEMWKTTNYNCFPYRFPLALLYNIIIRNALNYVYSTRINVFMLSTLHSETMTDTLCSSRVCHN